MKIDKNFTAIVTGGASGIGQATVRLLVQKQARVIIADLNVKNGQKMAKQLNCFFFKTDVSNEENVKQLFEFAKKHFEQINLVLNCAGIFIPAQIIHNDKVNSTEIFMKILKINVIGTFNISKYAALYMSKQKLNAFGQRGVIIMISSIAAQQGKPNQIAYSSSKGAISGMILPMARDLGKYGIRVMGISPGLIDTFMIRQLKPPNVTIQQLFKPLTSITPLGRVGKPSQIAQLVKSIVQNPFATGTSWRIDGGMRVGL